MEQNADNNIAYPFTLDEERFLLGPDNENGDIEVDDIFAKSFKDVILYLLTYFPEEIRIPYENPIHPACISEDGYQYTEVGAGILALDKEGNFVGGYLSHDLAVHEEHQSKGVGKELIIRTALLGNIPPWYLDVPSYSNDGLEAHKSAHSYARNNPDVIQKMCQQLGIDQEKALDNEALSLSP